MSTLAYLLVVLVFTVSAEASKCSVQTSNGCGGCVTTTAFGLPCRWCPRDSVCHDPGALGTNPCAKEENIVALGDCKLNETGLVSLSPYDPNSSVPTTNHLDSLPYTDACLAPVGTWGPVCSSRISFVGNKPDTTISYSIEPTVDTAVFCRVLGSACDGFGYTCCFDLHPRNGAGNPVWGGDISVIWGDNAGSPQIQCYSSAIPTTVQWKWGGGARSKFGCWNGYNCQNTNTC